MLPTAYKVLSYVLLARLEPYTEQILGEYQCGFCRNQSTVDQVFLLKQVMEKKREFAQSVACLWVATEVSKMKVKVGRGLTQEFEVVTDLKQGDALSPTLFNWVFEHVIRKVLLIDSGVELNGQH